MDFSLSKEHEMARQLFKDFAEKEIIRKRAWNALLHDSVHQAAIAKSSWERFPDKMRKAAQNNITARNKTEKARNISRKMAENMRNLLKTKTEEEINLINKKRALPALKRFHGTESCLYKQALASSG